MEVTIFVHYFIPIKKKILMCFILMQNKDLLNQAI